MRPALQRDWKLDIALVGDAGTEGEDADEPCENRRTILFYPNMGLPVENTGTGIFIDPIGILFHLPWRIEVPECVPAIAGYCGVGDGEPDSQFAEMDIVLEDPDAESVEDVADIADFVE